MPTSRTAARASAASSGGSTVSRPRARRRLEPTGRPTPSAGSWRLIPETTPWGWSPTTATTCWPRCRLASLSIFTGTADKTKPRLHILAIGTNAYEDKGWGPPGEDALGFAPLGLAVKD